MEPGPRTEAASINLLESSSGRGERLGSEHGAALERLVATCAHLMVQLNLRELGGLPRALVFFIRHGFKQEATRRSKRPAAPLKKN